MTRIGETSDRCLVNGPGGGSTLERLLPEAGATEDRTLRTLVGLAVQLPGAPAATMSLLTDERLLADLAHDSPDDAALLAIRVRDEDAPLEHGHLGHLDHLDDLDRRS